MPSDVGSIGWPGDQSGNCFHGQSKIAFAALNVSTRPGPHGGCFAEKPSLLSSSFTWSPISHTAIG